MARAAGTTTKKTTGTRPTCGIVMPISAMDGYAEEHWADVLGIVSSAAEKAGYTPNLVSNSLDSGVIQKRIVQNLYENPIVVCDVSAKNANVMFELGMRLAFDKPTIIIKDDKTGYSFDTSVIEHLNYPKDLRYQTIIEFSDMLSEKIRSSSKLADKGNSFLKQFGSYKLAELDEKTITSSEALIQEIRELKDTVVSMRNSSSSVHSSVRQRKLGEVTIDELYDAIRNYRRSHQDGSILEQREEIMNMVEAIVDAPIRMASHAEFKRLFDQAFDRYATRIRRRLPPQPAE